jgi:hypothetical protein
MEPTAANGLTAAPILPAQQLSSEHSVAQIPSQHVSVAVTSTAMSASTSSVPTAIRIVLTTSSTTTATTATTNSSSTSSTNSPTFLATAATIKTNKTATAATTATPITKVQIQLPQTPVSPNGTTATNNNNNNNRNRNRNNNSNRVVTKKTGLAAVAARHKNGFHVNGKPPRKATSGSGAVIKQCEICGTPFRSAKSYKRHMDQCHVANGPRHVCCLCQRVFKRSDNLSAHYRSVHFGVKPNKCANCGKGYRTKNELYR